MIACDHPVGETLSNAAIKMLFLVFQILHKIFRHEKTFKVNTSYFTIDMSLNIVIFIFSQLWITKLRDLKRIKIDICTSMIGWYGV